MTEADRADFLAAWVRTCSMQGRPYDSDQAAALFESRLRLYPLAMVLEAIEAAAMVSGRFLPALGDIAKVIEDLRGEGREQSRMASRGARYWQDERGQTHVESRCWQCQDEGFAVVLCTPDGTSTGEVITMEDLRRRERESSERVHYRRKRCACRTAGMQWGAA